MANTVKAPYGVEVYESKIYELADEYICNLDDPESINNSSKSIFVGMIKYIYINLFKIYPLDNSDIESIDKVWDIYTSLCYKYSKRPTIINFSLMVGIGNDTLNSWKKEDTRGYIYFDDKGNRIPNFPAWRINHPNDDYRQEPSSSHSQTVKKWLAECESSLLDGAIENNSIGCIFGLKANYGYVETAQRIEISTKDQSKSIEQITAEHMQIGHKSETELELPDGDF